jgi:glycosyltransferase involved in cell wall biosynthesis
MTGAVTAAIRAATLLEQDARFLLILPYGSRVPADRLPPNMAMLTLPSPSLKKSLGGLLAYPGAVLQAARNLRNALREHGVACLLVNDFYLLPGPLVRPLGWGGRIVTMVRIDTRRFGLPGRLWLTAARRWSDSVLAVSHFIEKAAGLPPGSVVYDPAPPIRPATDDVCQTPRLLFVGNYIRGKGQDAGIRAFHRIANDFPEAELHFHGGDMGLVKNRAYREELERAARNGAGVGRIRFFGFACDTAPLLARARASLTLSHSESFSFTCQEASAQGVAVIATRCGGPEEIVEDGFTGFLVDIDDDAVIADRMARLLSDPGLAAAMGGRGAALMAARFSAAPWRERMLEVLGLRQARVAR